MSTAGGVATAIDRARSIGCTAMQIFVKNNMQWFAKPFAADEVRAFLDHPERARLGSVFGHAGYLINLAAANADFLEKSRRALHEELVRGDQLELPFLVLHPGAHMGAGEEAGLRKVVASLDEIHAGLPKIRTRVALEITAGQGTCLGHTFEHLAFIIEQAKEPDRLCVCLDTAHLFAAGYDISTLRGVRKVFSEFEKIVGFERLVALHLNDSKTGLNSRVDRHDHIGKGKIGLAPFRYIMRDPRFKHLPKVLETPKGKDLSEDVANMAALRGLMQSAKE